MRKFILLATLLMSTTMAYASHYSLGYITYKWAGDSAFYGQDDYEIEVGVYRYIPGVAIGNGNITIEVIRNCGSPAISSYSESITYIPPTPNQVHPNDPLGRKIEMNNNCTDSLSGQWALYIYRKVITVDLGSCDDYILTPVFPCCRDIKDNVPSGSLGVYARLNKAKGPVSMPVPNHAEMISRFCVNQNFTIGPLIGNANAYDQSLERSVPLNASILLDTLGYDTAYSINQPLPVAPGTNYLLNPANRTVNFTPQFQGNYSLAFNYNQFEFDTATSSQYLAGSMHFETVVIVSSTCDSVVSAGPEIKFSNNTRQMASGCGLQTVNFASSSPILKSSLDTNGSEFRALSPGGAPVPIVDARLTSSDTISISFFNPLQTNGRYRIYTKPGNDGNLFTNSCGFESLERDTFFLDISGCSNVGLANTTPASRIQIFPNPTQGVVKLKGSSINAVNRVHVSSIDGKVNREIALRDGNTIDLQGITAGVYFVTISFKDQSSVERHKLIVR